MGLVGGVRMGLVRAWGWGWSGAWGGSSAKDGAAPSSGPVPVGFVGFLRRGVRRSGEAHRNPGRELAPLVGLKDALSETCSRLWRLCSDAVPAFESGNLTVRRSALPARLLTALTPPPLTTTFPAAGICRTSVTTWPLTLWLRILILASVLLPIPGGTATAGVAAGFTTTVVEPPAAPLPPAAPVSPRSLASLLSFASVASFSFVVSLPPARPPPGARRPKATFTSR